MAARGQQSTRDELENLGNAFLKEKVQLLTDYDVLNLNKAGIEYILDTINSEITAIIFYASFFVGIFYIFFKGFLHGMADIEWKFLTYPACLAVIHIVCAILEKMSEKRFRAYTINPENKYSLHHGARILKSIKKKIKMIRMILQRLVRHRVEILLYINVMIFFCTVRPINNSAYLIFHSTAIYDAGLAMFDIFAFCFFTKQFLLTSRRFVKVRRRLHCNVADLKLFCERA